MYDLSLDAVSKVFNDAMVVDNVSLDVPKGSFFSILGPSGCGKTTLLRMIAGFTPPSSGIIAIRGKNMKNVPPNRRPVNLVFQHLALFPMMNVAENIAFGLRRRGISTREARNKAEDMLARVGLTGYADKQISQLSGGQKQRVAIARCLVLEPSVLLLDEPLGALDLKLREKMKVELKSLQATVGTTFVYITHDQSEALMMSDNVAVMNHGVFEQVGTPQDLYGNPTTAFVAGFVGENNMWPSVAEKKNGNDLTVRTAEGFIFHAKIPQDTSLTSLNPSKRTKTPPPQITAKSTVKLFVRPESLIIEPQETTGLNIFTVTLKTVLFDGANSRLLTVTDQGHELLVHLPQNKTFTGLEPGRKLSVGWHPEKGLCFADTDPKTQPPDTLSQTRKEA